MSSEEEIVVNTDVAENSGTDAVAETAEAISDAPVAKEYDPSKVVYITRYPESVTEDDIRALLSPFGIIEKMNMKKPMNGKGSMAFVDFTESLSATKAVEALNQKPGLGVESLIVDFKRAPDPNKDRNRDQRDNTCYLFRNTGHCDRANCKFEHLSNRGGGRFNDRGRDMNRYQGDRVRRDRSGSRDRYDDRRGGYDDRDRRGGYDDRDRRGGYDDRDRRGGYDDRRGSNLSGGNRGPEICYSFQRGQCHRGSSCKYVHQEGGAGVGGGSAGGFPRGDYDRREPSYGGDLYRGPPRDAPFDDRRNNRPIRDNFAPPSGPIRGDSRDHFDDRRNGGGFRGGPDNYNSNDYNNRSGNAPWTGDRGSNGGQYRGGGGGFNGDYRGDR
jgi:RNA recognition motif-containing protein